MIYQSRISHLFKPGTTLFQLSKAETIYGLKLRVFFVFLASAIIFSLSGLFGIGTEAFSYTLIVDPSDVFQWHKLLFVGGKFLSGLFYAACILFIPSLYFGIFGEAPFLKLVVLQVFTLTILLIEQFLYIPLALLLGLDWYSSPISLGVIANYFTSNLYVIAFLGSISLFKIWTFYIQYKGLQALSDKKRFTIFLLVLSLNIVLWAFTALITYINFYSLL